VQIADFNLSKIMDVGGRASSNTITNMNPRWLVGLLPRGCACRMRSA